MLAAENLGVRIVVEETERRRFKTGNADEAHLASVRLHYSGSVPLSRIFFTAPIS
jgi:hypothetical protein